MVLARWGTALISVFGGWLTGFLLHLAIANGPPRDQVSWAVWTGGFVRRRPPCRRCGARWSCWNFGPPCARPASSRSRTGTPWSSSSGNARSSSSLSAPKTPSPSPRFWKSGPWPAGLGPLPAPSPIVPSAGATVIHDGAIEFAWSQVMGAVSYTIEVAHSGGALAANRTVPGLAADDQPVGAGNGMVACPRKRFQRRSGTLVVPSPAAGEVIKSESPVRES